MWTWQINSITPNSDKITFTLIYTVTNGIDSKQITETSVSATPPDDIKSTCIRKCNDAVNFLNKVDAQKAAALSVDISNLIGNQDTVVAAVEAEKQAELPPSDPQVVKDAEDLQIFQQLLSDINIAEGCENFNITPIRPDGTVLDTSVNLRSQVPKLFKPSYSSLLQKRSI